MRKKNPFGGFEGYDRGEVQQCFDYALETRRRVKGQLKKSGGIKKPEKPPWIFFLDPMTDEIFWHCSVWGNSDFHFEKIAMWERLPSREKS